MLYNVYANRGQLLHIYCCCSHMNSHNQVRGHRTGSSHSGMEEYPREKTHKPTVVHAYIIVDAILMPPPEKHKKVKSGVKPTMYGGGRGVMRVYSCYRWADGFTKCCGWTGSRVLLLISHAPRNTSADGESTTATITQTKRRRILRSITTSMDHRNGQHARPDSSPRARCKQCLQQCLLRPGDACYD